MTIMGHGIEMFTLHLLSPQSLGELPYSYLAFPNPSALWGIGLAGHEVSFGDGIPIPVYTLIFTSKECIIVN
jgi:hypothetical protein